MNSKVINKPVLYLICGLPGSGKTTLAKEIETSTGAIRFCPDEWIKDIWGTNAETEGNKYRDHIEQLQWKIARNLLRSGVSVIIEWGTWGKREREKLRDEAREIGAAVKFNYLEVPREVLKERILERNKNLGEYEFLMSEETLDEVLDESIRCLEVPDKEEFDLYDYLG